MQFRELKLRKDPDCPVCGTHPTVTKLIDYEQFCGVRPPRRSRHVRREHHATEITSVELKQRLDRGDELTIVDVREPNEYQINRIPGSELIPLGDIPKRYVELDPERRDRRAVQDRAAAARRRRISCDRSGSSGCSNLKGGILDWIDKVDPSQPKY